MKPYASHMVNVNDLKVTCFDGSKCVPLSAVIITVKELEFIISFNSADYGSADGGFKANILFNAYKSNAMALLNARSKLSRQTATGLRKANVAIRDELERMKMKTSPVDKAECTPGETNSELPKSNTTQFDTDKVCNSIIERFSEKIDTETRVGDNNNGTN
jgi:hypothetical protein